jgi:hypothetical protein
MVHAAPRLVQDGAAFASLNITSVSTSDLGVTRLVKIAGHCIVRPAITGMHIHALAARGCGCMDSGVLRVSDRVEARTCGTA